VLLREGIVLPSRQFSRIAIALAILVAVLLVLVLQTVHSPQSSLLFSNSLDLAMVLLAALCSLYVARCCSGYARQLWTLLAVALTLETMAQAISTYYQSFVPGSAEIPWPSDVLFFLWVAPVFMMFLPSSDSKSPGFDWLRLLDFAQVGIVAATAYLYFFYIPSRWQSNHAALERQILVLYIVRDLSLSTGFLLRARTSPASWLRFFSRGMAVVFLAVVLSDGDYLLTLGTFTGSASWGDLLWALPYFLLVILAATWNYQTDAPLPESPSRFVDFVLTHVLPVGIPLLVIFMGRRIATEQLLIAWLAITASFICSALRLILTNQRQRQIANELRGTELALRPSQRIFASAFRWSPDAITINVFPDGPFLDVNEGFTRLSGYSREEILDKTPLDLNLWVDPALRVRFFSRLTEKGELHEEMFRFRTKSGQVRIGQMSAAVVDLDGGPCALVVVRDVTARIEAENILRTNEERFRTLVRDLHVAVVLHAPDASIQFANRSALDMFGFSEQAVLGKQVQDLGLIAVDENARDIPFSDIPVSHVLRTHAPVRAGIMGWRRTDSKEIRWIFGNAIPQFDANGSILRVISSFSDITEMKSAERSIHQLSTQLLQLQDEERRRIGRELHDGLAQTVLAVNLSLAQVRQSIDPLDDTTAQALLKARGLLQQMSREIRTLSYLLHPPLLDDLGLVSALKEYAHGFSERSGIDVQLYLLTAFDRLPQPTETALFRIVQESLANVQRHSGSASARIRLRQDASKIILEVTDFGGGMSLPVNGNPQLKEAHMGVGIPGMRERMAQLGGQLEIDSGPSGTTIRATIPLPDVVSSEKQDDAPSHSHRG